MDECHAADLQTECLHIKTITWSLWGIEIMNMINEIWHLMEECFEMWRLIFLMCQCWVTLWYYFFVNDLWKLSIDVRWDEVVDQNMDLLSSSNVYLYEELWNKLQPRCFITMRRQRKCALLLYGMTIYLVNFLVLWLYLWATDLLQEKSVNRYENQALISNKLPSVKTHISKNSWNSSLFLLFTLNQTNSWNSSSFIPMSGINHSPRVVFGCCCGCEYLVDVNA